jgi:hypothetical protein
MWIAMVIVVILVGIAVGVGAYNAGLHQGLAESGRGGEVVRVVGPGFGFFPFGFFLFPLFFIGLLLLLRGAFWRGRWGGPGPGHHEWRGGPPRFEEWHRRMHEEAGGEPPAEAPDGA